MNAPRITTALRLFPTSTAGATVRTVAPVVAGALLLIGCGASSDTPETVAAIDDDESSLEAMIDAATVPNADELQRSIDAGMDCEIVEGGWMCEDPDVVLIHPSDPPADLAPSTIPDGVYRGTIERAARDQVFFEPEALATLEVGPSEMTVEVVGGEIAALTATMSHSYEPFEGDGWTLCGVEQTDEFVGEVAEAWVDGDTFRSPTVSSMAGERDCLDGSVEEFVDFWMHPDVVGEYADGVMHIEFYDLWDPNGISAVLVAD